MKKILRAEDFANCPLPITAHGRIQLSHGSGGKMMHDLVSQLFVWAFDNSLLSKRNDSAVLEIDGKRLAFTTDSYVVDPIFFPGGDIGELAVNGTINDLAMSGARPIYLSTGFIIEEGFPLDDLKRVVISMKQTAAEAGVSIVTGDTKVVNKGKGDKLFINTAGIGIIEHNLIISSDNLKPGDAVIVSGSIAEHGIAILSVREGLAFETTVESDTAPLHSLVQKIVATAGSSLHALRDPTRGGLAATLNEFAESSQVGIRLSEDRILIKPPVAGACELLGLDPLYVANEGKLVAVVAKDIAERVLSAMKSHPLGKESAIIGEVFSEPPGMVTMRTRIGGWRIVDMPVGEQLPRIC